VTCKFAGGGAESPAQLQLEVGPCHHGMRMGHFRGYLAPHQEQPERPSQFYWDGERFMLLRHSGVLCHGGIHLSHHKQIKSPSWIFRRGSGLRPITPRLTHQSLESQHSSNLTHPLLPGLIAGCYADHFRRDSVIKVAGFLSVLSLGALVVVVLADGPNPKDTIPIPGPLLHSTTLISNPYAIDSFLFSMRLMAPPVANAMPRCSAALVCQVARAPPSCFIFIFINALFNAVCSCFI